MIINQKVCDPNSGENYSTRDEFGASNVTGNAVSHITCNLIHWGRVTYICVSKLTIFGPDNGLSPGRGPAIICAAAGIFVNLNHKNKLQWNLKRNLYISIQENAFENFVCDGGNLFRPRYDILVRNIDPSYDWLMQCRNDNVFITSKRRRRRRFDVVKTLSLRCVPAGKFILQYILRYTSIRSQIYNTICSINGSLLGKGGWKP